MGYIAVPALNERQIKAIAKDGFFVYQNQKVDVPSKVIGRLRELDIQKYRVCILRDFKHVEDSFWLEIKER